MYLQLFTWMKTHFYIHSQYSIFWKKILRKGKQTKEGKKKWFVNIEYSCIGRKLWPHMQIFLVPSFSMRIKLFIEPPLYYMCISENIYVYESREKGGSELNRTSKQDERRMVGGKTRSVGVETPGASVLNVTNSLNKTVPLVAPLY